MAILESASGSLRAQVFAELERAIITGEYKDGDRLSELELSRRYGVSRTPVREALMQLELEGLVRNTPNKGAVVIGVTQKDIDDIFSVRVRIEGMAARLCAENIDDDGLLELERAAQLQEFYLSRGETELISELDSRFHELIFEYSGNRPLKLMLSHFHNYIQKARSSSVRTVSRARSSVAEHGAIVVAMRERNGADAERLMTEHIIHAHRSIHNESEDSE